MIQPPHTLKAAQVPADNRDQIIPNQRAYDQQPAEEFSIERFVACWPLVETALRRLLEQRGCPRTDSADVAQETAERLITRKVPFADASDLARYAFTVAIHLHISQHRLFRAHMALSCAYELPEQTDIPRTVECRLALNAVLHEIKALGVGDQRLLIGGPSGATGGSAWANGKVRRHRLRKRLRSQAGGLLPF